MQTSLNILQNARIAAPCSAEWSAMQGDERVRFCGQCEKNVYNLIGMDDNEADALLAEHEGHACIRAYQRADGTLMTQNCPVGLRKVRQRMAWGIGSIAAGFAMLLSSFTFGLSRRAGARLSEFEPFARLVRLVRPTAPIGVVLGSPSPTSASSSGIITYTIMIQEDGKTVLKQMPADDCTNSGMTFTPYVPKTEPPASQGDNR